MKSLGSILTVILLSAGVGHCQDVPKEEPLPSPRAAAPQILLPRYVWSPYAPPDPPPQFGRRDAWQMFAVDRFGRFRPRVIYSPYGNSYYQIDGAPFPWTTTIPRLYMPYIID